jgi:hypothetical protein
MIFGWGLLTADLTATEDHLTAVEAGFTQFLTAEKLWDFSKMGLFR